MKSFIFYLFLSSFLFVFDSLAAKKGESGPNNKDFNQFFRAICAVESNNNPKAFNKSENAKGIAQIREKCLIDSNFFGKTKYSPQDCFNAQISKIICFNYLARYQKTHNWNFEKMAKTWNGGGGYAKSGPTTQKNLEIYWGKVKKELDKIDKL